MYFHCTNISKNLNSYMNLTLKTVENKKCIIWIIVMHCGIVLNFIFSPSRHYVAESGSVAWLGNRPGLVRLSSPINSIISFQHIKYFFPYICLYNCKLVQIFVYLNLIPILVHKTNSQTNMAFVPSISFVSLPSIHQEQGSHGLEKSWKLVLIFQA